MNFLQGAAWSEVNFLQGMAWSGWPLPQRLGSVGDHNYGRTRTMKRGLTFLAAGGAIVGHCLALCLCPKRDKPQ